MSAGGIKEKITKTHECKKSQVLENRKEKEPRGVTQSSQQCKGKDLRTIVTKNALRGISSVVRIKARGELCLLHSFSLFLSVLAYPSVHHLPVCLIVLPVSCLAIPEKKKSEKTVLYLHHLHLPLSLSLHLPSPHRSTQFLPFTSVPSLSSAMPPHPSFPSGIPLTLSPFLPYSSYLASSLYHLPFISQLITPSTFPSRSPPPLLSLQFFFSYASLPSAFLPSFISHAAS